MSRLKDHKILVDVIVTSPPYNIIKQYGLYRDNKEKDRYSHWMQNVAEKSYHILKEDSSFFVKVGGQPVDDHRSL